MKDKQELWYLPKLNELVIVESRGRIYLCVYWGEDSFYENWRQGELVERLTFESIAEKVGEL